jgi:oligopeptide/dipeptide ABC transporter ATP-binding protein
MIASENTALLEVRNLCVSYGESNVVDRLSFSVQSGESLCLTGESGSGKSQTALAIMGLLPPNARVSGEVLFDGRNILGASCHVLNEYRARRMAMVFQDPMAALNPYVTIGKQLRRILIDHELADGGEANAKVLEVLKKVGLADAGRQFRAYPHELSGGMRQRALIASALIAGPALLIADEPTTALDVTVQAQILQLLSGLRRESGIALLLITHDLGVVATNSERMLVIDRGRLIEQGATRDLFARPSTPRAAQMIAAASGFLTAENPEMPAPPERSTAGSTAAQVLDIQNLSVTFRERHGGRKQKLRAVQDISLSVAPGETVAIVGESGSGKTSLARAVVGLLSDSTGVVSLLGAELERRIEARRKDSHRNIQMVFQDPVASLNPAMRVADIVAEPLLVHRAELPAASRREAVSDVLCRVGLATEIEQRYPHELSGGQAQRVAIARALILQPAILICDEAVAALDGSVRQEILAVLRAEQQRSSLSLLVITHDLAVVQQLSHRVLIMYMGRLFELNDSRQLFRRPRHPYSRLLLDATPLAGKSEQFEAPAVSGEAASILHPPSGCTFHPRCPYVIDRCRQERPELQPVDGGLMACHRGKELNLSR